MVDTSNVDIKAFYERYSRLHGRKPSRAWKTGEQEYHGSCPWCGGTDRFMFRYPSGRYSCKIRSSGCGRHGRDVIDFLREYEGMNFFEACEYLEIDPGSEYVRSEHAHEPLDVPPPEKWQNRARGVIRKAQQYLWAPPGQGALAFLHQRGFTDEMIISASLGYIPLAGGRWYKDSADLWGIEVEEGDDTGVWLPEGILIPWYIGGQIWRLNIRRLTGLKERDAKYIPVAGGSEGLYLADSIKHDVPAVLCESEFDALAGRQSYDSDDVVFVATGSTTRARRARWIARLCMPSRVLVAFDDDPLKNGKRAGDAGAKHWTDILPNAIRWTPWCHDVNDMLIQKMDIKKWVSLGLDVYQAMRTSTITQAEEREDEEMPVCADCGAPISDDSREFYFIPTSEDEAICYCSHCRDSAGQPMQQSKETMPREQFMSVVEEMTTVFPGVCTVHIDPPGYSIQDRARELAATQKAQGDFWAEIKARVLRPPVDERGRPFYTAEAWAKKWTELINQRPDPKHLAHLPAASIARYDR